MRFSRIRGSVAFKLLFNAAEPRSNEASITIAKQFRTAAAFKASLETHLRKRAEALGVPFSTLQLKFVIERLLARLFREENPPWLLKGGFAMELRFRPRARTTKDIDLSVALT